jgi:hypothetical protein
MSGEAALPPEPPLPRPLLLLLAAAAATKLSQQGHCHASHQIHWQDTWAGAHQHHYRHYRAAAAAAAAAGGRQTVGGNSCMCSAARHMLCGRGACPLQMPGARADRGEDEVGAPVNHADAGPI